MVSRKAAPRAALAIAFSTLLSAQPSLAQTASDDSSIPTITVIGTTPLSPAGLDADKLPGITHRLTADDLTREGPPSLNRALVNGGTSATASDTLGNAFQPDIFYHGFAASPVLGTPQGLAVYQNGVRVY